MAIDFKDLTLGDLMKAMPHLMEEGVEGRWVYNLEIEGDSPRITYPKMWVTMDGGKLEWGEGHSDDPDATLFSVLMGGVDTVIAFQVYGMRAATSAMLMGYISTSSIKRAEKWFRLFKIGQDVFVDALKKEGIEVGDTNLDIYGELMLA